MQNLTENRYSVGVQSWKCVNRDLYSQARTFGAVSNTSSFPNRIKSDLVFPHDPFYDSLLLYPFKCGKAPKMYLKQSDN